MQTTSNSITEIAQQTRTHARQLAVLPTEARNDALEAIAQALEAASEEILAANAEDCRQAETEGLSKPLYNRLKLNATKLQGAIAGVRNVKTLEDPVGNVQIHRELDTGLILKRITCSLGVLGVIFESRPDAVIQITSLAVKSGNGVILKGGREAIRSCQAIVQAIVRGLEKTAIDPAVVQLLTSREQIQELLQLDEYVDLIIPRGSNSFVRFVQENTQIPVLGHADGMCHVYLDRAADLEKAASIVVDSKTQYPAACNAVETLLVHADIANSCLHQVVPALQHNGVTLKGDDAVREIMPQLAAATEQDWSTEYSDLVLSIKMVDSIDQAMVHINQYGSGHTDAIVTEDPQAAKTFLAQVNSAGVFHNCSTRFSDGYRYGFGAEVGISTQQMPPRGPVGLEGLVTYKYQLTGDGHVAATYSGADAKSFTHRDLS